jgi:hypothetical protein
MQPLEAIKFVIDRQQGISLTFPDKTRAESFITCTRRYTDRYPSAYKVGRRGNIVYVVPGEISLPIEVRGIQAEIELLGLSPTGLDTEESRRKMLIIDEYISGNLDHSTALFELTYADAMTKPAAEELLASALERRVGGNDSVRQNSDTEEV